MGLSKNEPDEPHRRETLHCLSIDVLLLLVLSCVVIHLGIPWLACGVLILFFLLFEFMFNQYLALCSLCSDPER